MAKKGFKAENPNKRIAERTATEETKTPEPIKETEKAAVEDTALPKKETGQSSLLPSCCFKCLLF